MFRAVNGGTHFTDRFVPRRIEVNVDLINRRPSSYEPDPDVDEAEFINYAKIRYNRHHYRNALKNVLIPLDTKILNFFPPKRVQERSSQPREMLWPVIPRKKPVMGPPETILDMPQFDSNICHHVADWSSNNCLATIFENEVHMWYPDSEFLRASTKSERRVQHCVKWRCEGIQFAVGLFPNRVGIWDILDKKLICETSCCLPFCEIYCLEWINDYYLITGCSKGVLKVHTSNLKFLKKVRNAHNCAIINISSSCDKTYIATSSTDKTVKVWKAPGLEVLFQIKFKSIVRALAWHPWKSCLLAVGHGYNEGYVVLWNVKVRKQIAREKTSYKNSSIDCLTFNPISGELVVSYYVRSERTVTRGSGIIAVLTGIDEVVEELHIHNGPIPYLLWGRKGKVLASASADENLCIWDFFGTSRKEEKRNPKRKKANDKITQFSHIFRETIR